VPTACKTALTHKGLPWVSDADERRATDPPAYCYADLSKASQNREVIAFADHWHQVSGSDPALQIFDSKLTTQAVLAELDDRQIGFITLRARHPAVTKALADVMRRRPGTGRAACERGSAGRARSCAA